MTDATTQQLVQTIAILAGCIVFVASKSFDLYQRRRTNGVGLMSLESSNYGSIRTWIKELHDWHKPVKDPVTGQPKFPWYADAAELRDELQKSRAATEEATSAMADMSAKLAEFVDEVRELRNRLK